MLGEKQGEEAIVSSYNETEHEIIEGNEDQSKMSRVFFGMVVLSMMPGSAVLLISNIYYINDHLDKRTWTYILGACCATIVFISSFHNYRIWSFLGLGMTTYMAWYMTTAAAVHGQAQFGTAQKYLDVPK